MYADYRLTNADTRTTHSSCQHSCMSFDCDQHIYFIQNVFETASPRAGCPELLPLYTVQPKHFVIYSSVSSVIIMVRSAHCLPKAVAVVFFAVASTSTFGVDDHLHAMGERHVSCLLRCLPLAINLMNPFHNVFKNNFHLAVTYVCVCVVGIAVAFTPSPPLGNIRTVNTYKGGAGVDLRLSTVAPEAATKNSNDDRTAMKRPHPSKGTANKSTKKVRNSSKKGKDNNNIRSSKQRTNDKQSTKSFKPLKDLKLGSLITGQVVDICDFGAFIDIGYASRGSRAGTALLHVSQIQDAKIDNIRDVINVGDTVEARVINVDLVKGEVGLSLRKPRPKRKDLSAFKVGDKLVGRVDTVLPYGAFIDVGATANPLLHISRITGSAIENIRHYLNEGDSVPIHVIDIDVERKTMAVSMLDKKADQYLDRRMSQKIKRYFGTTRDTVDVDDESELDYFDKAIQELEAALKER